MAMLDSCITTGGWLSLVSQKFVIRRLSDFAIFCSGICLAQALKGSRSHHTHITTHFACNCSDMEDHSSRAESSSHSARGSWFFSTLRRSRPWSALLGPQGDVRPLDIRPEDQSNTQEQAATASGANEASSSEASISEPSSEASISHSLYLSNVQARNGSQRNGGQIHAANAVAAQADTPAASAERPTLDSSQYFDLQVSIETHQQTEVFLCHC